VQPGFAPPQRPGGFGGAPPLAPATMALEQQPEAPSPGPDPFADLAPAGLSSRSRTSSAAVAAGTATTAAPQQSSSPLGDFSASLGAALPAGNGGSAMAPAAAPPAPKPASTNPFA
jgi:hypothetical protein